MIAPPRTIIPARRNPAAELVFSAPPGAADRMQPQVALQQQAGRSAVQAELGGAQRQALLKEYISELQANGTPAKQALANKINEFVATQPIAAQQIETPADAIMMMTGMRG